MTPQDVFEVGHWRTKNSLQGGAPVLDSVQLVQITPISQWFIGDISIIFIGFLNQLITRGAPPYNDFIKSPEEKTEVWDCEFDIFLISYCHLSTTYLQNLSYLFICTCIYIYHLWLVVLTQEFMFL